MDKLNFMSTFLKARLHVQFMHAFWKNLHWLMYVYGNQYKYFQNSMQCSNCMRKWDVATRLKALVLRAVFYSRYKESF